MYLSTSTSTEDLPEMYLSTFQVLYKLYLSTDVLKYKVLMPGSDVCMCVCVYVCMCECVYVCMCVCMCACMLQVCIYGHALFMINMMCRHIVFCFIKLITILTTSIYF